MSEQEQTPQWFVGIDWGSEAHQVCVVSAAGAVVGERRVAHTGTALHELVGWLRQLSGEALPQMAVAIEVPRGAVVETLLGHQLRVAYCNPKQLHRFRERETVAGAKDDRRDARVLASALRTDPHCFRFVATEDARIIQLREWARAEADVQEESRRLSNRLREQLLRYYPAWLTLSPAMDEPWAWALWELAPTPAAAQRLRPHRVGTLLKAHRIRRVDTATVLAALRAPALTVAAGTAEAATAHVALLITRLRLLAQQQAACAKASEALLEALAHEAPRDPPPGPDAPSAPAGEATPAPARASDVTIFRSLPGVGRRVLAYFVSEASVALRARNYPALRAMAGVAPVTRQSGKWRGVVMRYACSARLCEACYHWARVSTQCDLAAKAYYADLRARGHSHARALRSLADRWLRILIAMLNAGTCYDPTRGRLPATA